MMTMREGDGVGLFLGGWDGDVMCWGGLDYWEWQGRVRKGGFAFRPHHGIRGWFLFLVF
jgi:hypothetical protein